MAKKNELQVVKPMPDAGYEIMRSTSDEIDEFVAGLKGIKISDLQKITTPPASGQGTPRWVIDDQMVEEIIGIPIFHAYHRIFWPKKLGEDPLNAGGPPACRSSDQDSGIGVRFDGDDVGPHLCGTCPHAQFETRGRAQACKERMRIVILRPESILPMILDLSVTSLKQTRNLFMRMTSQRNPYTKILGKPWMSEVGWKLQTTQNKDAIRFNVALPRKVRDLTSEELSTVAIMVEKYMPIFRSAKVEEMTASSE